MYRSSSHCVSCTRYSSHSCRFSLRYDAENASPSEALKAPPEELLYLARQRMYARRRAAGAMAIAKTSPNQVWQPPAPGVQSASHDLSRQARRPRLIAVLPEDPEKLQLRGLVEPGSRGEGRVRPHAHVQRCAFSKREAATRIVELMR